jgi:hypothetical protein
MQPQEKNNLGPPPAALSFPQIEKASDGRRRDKNRSELGIELNSEQGDLSQQFDNRIAHADTKSKEIIFSRVRVRETDGSAALIISAWLVIINSDTFNFRIRLQI